MCKTSPAAGWIVDRTDDPSARVSYLDAVTALESTRAYKDRTFALMGVHPGHAVLDVGCGAGDDLRHLAELVGTSGRVVGVDSCETMLREARDRTKGLPVECHIGDAHHLEFDENSFDSCRADRVFQHLESPVQAFSELVRVAQPGARIVVIDPDWDTVIVNAADRALTRRILAFRCDLTRNGWMGRQLPALAQHCGLIDLTILPVPVVFTDWFNANQVLGLQWGAEEAATAGLVSPAESGAWIRDLEQSDASGRFFAAATGVMVAGRKP